MLSSYEGFDAHCKTSTRSSSTYALSKSYITSTVAVTRLNNLFVPYTFMTRLNKTSEDRFEFTVLIYPTRDNLLSE